MNYEKERDEAALEHIKGNRTDISIMLESSFKSGYDACKSRFEKEIERIKFVFIESTTNLEKIVVDKDERISEYSNSILEAAINLRKMSEKLASRDQTIDYLEDSFLDLECAYKEKLSSRDAILKDAIECFDHVLALEYLTHGGSTEGWVKRIKAEWENEMSEPNKCDKCGSVWRQEFDDCRFCEGTGLSDDPMDFMGCTSCRNGSVTTWECDCSPYEDEE